MDNDRKTTVRNTTETRQGTTEHVTRYVLGIGLPIAIIAMVLVYQFVL